MSRIFHKDIEGMEGGKAEAFLYISHFIRLQRGEKAAFALAVWKYFFTFAK